MLKLFFVIFANFHRAPYIVPKMRYMADHPQKYSEAERYDMMRHCIDLMNKSGKITTEAYGLENLPETGGYIMYPNHQGKYDLLGIITTHDKVLSFVMDKQKSHTMLVREFVDLVQGQTGLVDGEGLAGRAGEVALAGDGNCGGTGVDVGGVRNGVILICLKRSAADRNGHFRSMCLGVIGHVSDRRERAAGNFRRIDSEGLFRRAREVIAYTGDDDLRSTGVDVVLIGNRVVGISC